MRGKLHNTNNRIVLIKRSGGNWPDDASATSDDQKGAASSKRDLER